MATTTKATLNADTDLVQAYLEVANTRQEGAWYFVRLTQGKSVRTIQDSIKQAKKECGVSLPDLTPTKAQHFATLLSLDNKVEAIEEVLTFAKAYSIAEKADRAYGADTARKAIAEAESLEEIIAGLPKNVRKAQPNKGKKETADGFSLDEVLDHLITTAETMEKADRVRIVKQLTATANLIKALDKVGANA